MIACNCIVQEGQISAETEATLRAHLATFSQRAFGEPAEISWLAVPKNSGFTASRPSTSSIISIRANAPVPQDKREVLLHELCGLWTQETHCTLDEVVGVISNPETV